MTSLPPEASALLEKARREHNPSEADAERVRRALHAKLGIAAALAPAATSLVTGKVAAGTSTSVAAGGAGTVVQAGVQSGAALASHGGSVLFGLKVSKVLLTVMALSGVASVPLIMRSDVRPRSPQAQCASAPCPELESPAIYANGALDPRVEPTPTAESLEDKSAGDRRSRRAERRAKGQRAARSDGLDPRDARDVDGARDARDVDGARDVREARDVPGELGPPAAAPAAATPSELGQLASIGAVAARDGEASGARVAASAGLDSALGGSGAAASDARSEQLGATEVEASTANAPSAPPELALIRAALTSLRDGAPRRALALLSEHSEAYPEGAFASERRGLRIVALCASGRLDEGRRERVVFLRREGSAPVAERVRHACQEAPGR